MKKILETLRIISTNKKMIPNASKESDNPYMSARKMWNEHISVLVESRRSWQIVCLVSLFISALCVFGIIYIGSKSKFVPYIVQVDKLGQVLSIGTAGSTTSFDQRIIRATVIDFIKSIRMVSVDRNLQTQSIYKIYSLAAPRDPATEKINMWYTTSKPFDRAKSEYINVKILSALVASSNTWQIDWSEEQYDTTGVLKSKINMRALITVYVATPTSQTTEEQLYLNPLGIFIKDFTWDNLLN